MKRKQVNHNGAKALARTPAKEVGLVSAHPAPGDEIIRKGSATGKVGQIVRYMNRWRENYNPFRYINMRKAVEYIEMGQRGDYALLQWTFRKLERNYPTLCALISRCEAPLLNFKWDIKIKSQMPDGATEEMAKKQQTTLRNAYERIDNLRAAIKHAHLAEFRGYSHMQKHRDANGDVIHLECLDQWNVCRDGLYGDWFWNPDSKFTTTPEASLGNENRIGGDVLLRNDFLIFETPRPLNEIALISCVRWLLANKDNDAFLEIYGVPSGVVEMPPNVPPEKESAYEASAKEIAEGGSGALPNGSKYFPNTQPRGGDPFTPRYRQLAEELVLAGTGGKMSMLNAQSGLGGGNQGEQHDDVFQEIAEGRAVEISEMFQRQFDIEVLGKMHPGEPVLVYFELAPRTDVDVDSLVKNITALKGSGFKARLEWVMEQTGYDLEEDAAAAQPGELQGRLQKLAKTDDGNFDEEFQLFNRDFPGVGRLLLNAR